jgi:hypothetical protein
MKRAPVDPERCTAHAHTAVNGEGARCMRRRAVGCGTLCKQHWQMSFGPYERNRMKVQR